MTRKPKITSCCGGLCMRRAPETISDKDRARFWTKVTKLSDCWEFSGKSCGGYGYFKVGRKYYKATLISWMLEHGAPPSLWMLHHCDNPACVRPDHLWEGTARDNAQDCLAKGRNHYAQLTACKNGHPFSPENTYIRAGGRRQCRTCNRAAFARLAMRRKAA